MIRNQFKDSLKFEKGVKNIDDHKILIDNLFQLYCSDIEDVKEAYSNLTTSLNLSNNSKETIIQRIRVIN